MNYSKGRAITFSRLIILASLLLLFYLLHDVWLPIDRASRIHETSRHSSIQNFKYQEIPYENDVPQTQFQSEREPCIDGPGAENVLVMLKTGASELYQKLPTHFVTTFKCAPHFAIYSDLAQELADYPVHDAIASVSPRFSDQHPDFELYRKLQQYQREGQDMSTLQGGFSWNLDKWKFLPMMHHAFTNASNEIEWFVMIEADTSLSWTNLLQWLRRMDPRKPSYFGAQNLIGGTDFAHGGSGIVVSRKAADLLEQAREREGKQAFDERWEQLTSETCCGDEIVARAFREVDVALTHAWPLIQGETVASLDWTDRHWCTPAISWHHVTPIEIDALWQFESAWVREKGWNTPFLYRDIFDHFIQRHVGANRTKWNNLSKDHKFVSPQLTTGDKEGVANLSNYQKRAFESEQACVEACLEMAEEECIQWMYSPGRCYLGKVVRFGHSDESESDHWTSGWIQDRLEKFKKRHEGCEALWIV